MNVLVAIDFSPVTQRIMQVVRRVAKSPGAKIMLLHVAGPNPEFVGYEAGPEVVQDQVDKEYKKEYKQVQELSSELRREGFKAEDLCIPGSTVETILDEAGRIDAELIIVGSHGHGAMYDLVVGSVSEGLVRQSKRPILVVPAQK